MGKSSTKKPTAVTPVAFAVSPETQRKETEQDTPGFYRATELIFAGGRLWNRGEVRASEIPLERPLWESVHPPTETRQ